MTSGKIARCQRCMRRLEDHLGEQLTCPGLLRRHSGRFEPMPVLSTLVDGDRLLALASVWDQEAGQHHQRTLYASTLHHCARELRRLVAGQHESGPAAPGSHEKEN